MAALASASGVVSTTEIHVGREMTMPIWELCGPNGLFGDKIRAFSDGSCRTVLVVLEEERGGGIFSLECSPDQRIMADGADKHVHGTWVCAKDVRPGMSILCYPRIEDLDRRNFIWPFVRSVTDWSRCSDVYYCHTPKGVEVGPNGIRRPHSYFANRVLCLAPGVDDQCPCVQCRATVAATVDHLTGLVDQKLVL